MAINLFGLNSSPAAITRQKIEPSTLRLDLNTVKLNFEQAKTNSRDLVLLSGQASVVGKAILQSNIDNIGTLNKSDNHSLDTFFLKNLPTQPKDENYVIHGVSFSNEDLTECRAVIKSAIDNMGVGVGKGIDIDYKHYAQMGIAEACVKNYASENLSKEQADVLNKAMHEYNKTIIGRQEQTYNNGNFVDTPYEAHTEYYGKARILSEGEIGVINDLKAQISKLTGRYIEPSQFGDVAPTPSATNKALISQITDLFSNIDCTNQQSINSVSETYKTIMKPAYTAYGLNDEHGSLTRVLNADVEHFKNLFSQIMNTANANSLNFNT